MWPASPGGGKKNRKKLFLIVSCLPANPIYVCILKVFFFFCNGVLFSVTDKVYHWFIIIYSGMYDEQGRIVGRITTYIYSLDLQP